MAPRVGKARKRTTKTETENTQAASYFSTVASRVNKKFGADTLMTFKDVSRIFATVKEFVSTQCYGLDYAMHLPGLPVGRVCCIRGNFMSGKSTLADHVIAETQKMGGIGVLIDTEYAFDKDRCEAIGMVVEDESKFLMPQVDTLEDAITVIDECIDVAREEQDAGNTRLVTIVWDSVGASVPKAELEAAFGESRPGLHARLMSSFLRRVTRKIAEYRILLILVNQEKDRVDFFSQGKDVTTMLAEKPIMFHSTVVLQPRMIGKLINTNKEPTGIRVKTTVMKNKLAAPFSKAEFAIGFGNPVAGIDNNASILSLATQFKITGKTGSWYTYQGKKFYEKDFGKLLREHPEIMEELERRKTRDARSNAKAVESDDDDSEADDEEENEEEEDEEEADAD